MPSMKGQQRPFLTAEEIKPNIERNLELTKDCPIYNDELTHLTQILHIFCSYLITGRLLGELIILQSSHTISPIANEAILKNIAKSIPWIRETRRYTQHKTKQNKKRCEYSIACSLHDNPGVTRVSS